MPLKVYKRNGFYWVRGVVRGHAVRQSLQTLNAEIAHRRAAEMELGMDTGLAPLTWDKFARHFVANYQGTTRRRYEWFLANLGEFMEARSLAFLHEARSLDLEAFLHRRPASPNTVRYEISKLRRIWSYAIAHDICRTNAAAKLTLPREDQTETQPFSDDELRALEAAIETVADEASLPGRAGALRDRLRAMYLVLLTTGIRVSDLVKLRPENLVDGYLVIRTQKTRATVRIPLLESAYAALSAIEVQSSGYYFWTGNSYKGACDSVWRSFARLGRRAGLQGVHPHRFRDTYAVNLLLAGADLRLVSKLLGHSSIRTTEKHYAPWVPGFQEQADAAVKAMQSRLERSTP